MLIVVNVSKHVFTIYSSIVRRPCDLGMSRQFKGIPLQKRSLIVHINMQTEGVSVKPEKYLSIIYFLYLIHSPLNFPVMCIINKLSIKL